MTRHALVLSTLLLALIPGLACAAEPVAVGPMISHPPAIAAFLAGVVALVYLASEWKPLAPLFKYLPPLVWMYFIPMLATTFGVTPNASPFYSPFMSRIALPAILVLLLITSDARLLAKLGWKAVGMMLIGTFGIVLGALGSFSLIQWLMPGALPAESWKGVAALSGSWIGGSANMTAVYESVGKPEGVVGPLIVVDTVVAYSWLGLLIGLSAVAARFDHWRKADTAAMDAVTLNLETSSTAGRAPRAADAAWMIGLALVVSQLCMAGGGLVAGWVGSRESLKTIAAVINASGWGILLVTAAGVLLSTTPVRKLDNVGATGIGYAGLYLLLTTYGAQANLRELAQTPAFMYLGIIWLVIHAVILAAGMWVLKAPLALAATASMANIGGPASAPVVAAAYNRSLAPVGLLMAVLGGILGTPVALFAVATMAKAIAGE